MRTGSDRAESLLTIYLSIGDNLWVLGPVWWRRVAVEMVDTSEENQVF